MSGGSMGNGGGAPIRVIAGPTASGKTGLGVAHALDVGGEVVSADSRQVFAGLVIGTAAPTPGEQRGVPHHLVGERDPRGGELSAGAFARIAEDRIDAIRARGAVPIVVGGTGFYLRALVHGLAPVPPVPADMRAAVADELRERGLAALVEELRTVDPDLAARTDLANPARVMRGVEVARATGRPLSAWQRAPPVPPRHRYAVEVLDVDAAELRRRIDARVGAMDRAGLYDEVRGLLDAGLSPALPAMRTIGYAEVAAHLLAGGQRSGTAWEAVLDAIRLRTWQYARRQRTFCRRLQ